MLLRTRRELDLTRPGRGRALLCASSGREFVFLAAAKVGGIHANNTLPGATSSATTCDPDQRDRCRPSQRRRASCCSSARPASIRKLAPQPMSEDACSPGRWSRPTSGTRSPRSPASRCARPIAASTASTPSRLMPTNLYGPGDNFDLQNSHVLPALIRKFHEAKLRRPPRSSVWGTGTPRREFLHVDDLADAVRLPDASATAATGIVNVGIGEDITIRELAELIGRSRRLPRRIVFDTTKPDGTPRKLLDVSRLAALGWPRRRGCTLEAGTSAPHLRASFAPTSRSCAAKRPRHPCVAAHGRTP